MKIGFLLHDISLGGGERILNMLMDRFALEGHLIAIYTWNKDWKNYQASYPTEVYTLQYVPVIKNKLSAYKEIKSVLKITKPDCLISFSWSLSEIALWAAKINGIPFIMSERCDPRYIPTSPIHRLLERILYWKSEGLVFQTEKVKNYFPKCIQRGSIVIPNPLIDDNLPVADYGSSKKEIVGIGRLSEQKNFALLIDAFAELNPNEYILKIYGEGPLRASLENQIEELGMRDKVILMGKVNRVVDHIKNSDIFVLSSIWEGMPNVLLESMAMGLACIATDVPSGGCRELIQNRENGILIPVNDKSALVNSLRTLIEDEELKKSLKKEAVKIRETNSKDRIIPMWVDYIKRVIANS